MVTGAWVGEFLVGWDHLSVIILSPPPPRSRLLHWEQYLQIYYSGEGEDGVGGDPQLGLDPLTTTFAFSSCTFFSNG